MPNNAAFTSAQLTWLKESQILVDTEMQRVVNKSDSNTNQTTNRNMAYGTNYNVTTKGTSCARAVSCQIL
ncbi:hypothetical protein PtB15_10B249 [Puccinia triticina]|nr:hypothetical protein PtB15_10B249 [Puccinia triticina]